VESKTTLSEFETCVSLSFGYDFHVLLLLSAIVLGAYGAVSLGTYGTNKKEQQHRSLRLRYNSFFTFFAKYALFCLLCSFAADNKRKQLIYINESQPPISEQSLLLVIEYK